MERKRPVPGMFYRHFKGNIYQIRELAKDSETAEDMVIYQGMYPPFQVWVRPLSMFLDRVDHEKYPMVKQKYRFEKVIPGQTDPGMDIAKTSVETPEKAEVLPESVTLPEEERPNPDLMEFLDADTFEQKKRILVGMRNRITDRLIDDLAAALDVTVEDGDLDERYRNLLFCVDTMERFEVNRLR